MLPPTTYPQRPVTDDERQLPAASGYLLPTNLYGTNRGVADEGARRELHYHLPATAYHPPPNTNLSTVRERGVADEGAGRQLHERGHHRNGTTTRLIIEQG